MTDQDPAATTRPRRRAATGAATPGTEPPAATSPVPVEIRQGAVARAEGSSIDVRQGAVGAARAGSVSVDQSALGAALTGDLSASQSAVRAVLARSAKIEQSFVRTLVANEVRVERATGVGILLARRVVGDVRVLLDWRGALAFGAAAGFVMGLVRRGGRKARASKGDADPT